MTIKEICEILKSKLINTGFGYGFVLNGKKYTPKRNNLQGVLGFFYRRNCNNPHKNIICTG